MKLVTTSLAVFLLLIHSSSYAEDSDRLLRDCNYGVQVLNNEANQSTDFNAAWRCVSFVDGVTTAFAFARGYYNLPDTRGFAGICLPTDKGLSVGQYVRITTKYMRENPENLFEPPIAQVVGALIDAYPC